MTEISVRISRADEQWLNFANVIVKHNPGISRDDLLLTVSEMAEKHGIGQPNPAIADLALLMHAAPAEQPSGKTIPSRAVAFGGRPQRIGLMTGPWAS